MVVVVMVIPVMREGCVGSDGDSCSSGGSGDDEGD